MHVQELRAKKKMGFELLRKLYRKGIENVNGIKEEERRNTSLLLSSTQLSFFHDYMK